ncbi:MAG: ferrochelatase [Dokdonella sp.]|nr:MAG: ferrochelatase [Gammaproteobacteria bacterium]TXI75352.1 MAG: ferrochelatase [Dokdonella sp.]
MSRYLAFPAPANGPSLAVLLVNLGTPDAPDAASVRRYLSDFLSDPRVVEQPRWLWWPILHGFVLRVRPARSAQAYKSIWTADGSPLQVGTRQLATRLDARFQELAPGRVKVVHAMRYGAPSLADTLAELAREGMQRLLVVPLFPQFSATTTASVMDDLGRVLARWRKPPELRFVSDYHADELHIDALAQSVRAHWQSHGRGERLLLSFHGIPQRYVESGDPYLDQCRATAAALQARLGIEGRQIIACFQSRVGREPWLQPYFDETLNALAGQGVRSVDVLSPGFAVDCLETLEEIAMQGRDSFLKAGGEKFHFIACLNDSDDQVLALESLIRRHCAGWPELSQRLADPA